MKTKKPLSDRVRGWVPFTLSLVTIDLLLYKYTEKQEEPEGKPKP